MYIRQTEVDELDRVMEIYDKARRLMRDSGNAKQWVNGYPNRELIVKDIENGNSYVLIEGNIIHAVFTLIPGEDPTYKDIENGKWLNNEPYMTIHRIASNGSLRHAADICYDWALKRSGNLRIDTHEDNSIMRHVLDRNGFVKCGIIYIEDGSPRIAYQKVREWEQ